MPLKIKQIIKKIIHISTFSLIFILLFHFFNTNASENNNSKEYKNIKIKEIAQVWVAITTNIGMWKTWDSDKVQLYVNPEILSPELFLTNPEKTREIIIKNNMLFLQEYYNISKADFNKIIRNSNNKNTTINNLLKQLKIRYKTAYNNFNNLKKQRQSLLSEYERISNQIEALKRNLESHFNKNEAQNVFNDVDSYYSLKHQQTILKTNIIFINNFLKKYTILISYNSKIIEVIELNKDALSKNSYVVIPKSWTKLLKEFELLYSEDEFKKLKK